MKKRLLLFALLLLISGAMFGQDEYSITYSPNSSQPFNGCYLSGATTATTNSTVTVTINMVEGYELDSISAVDDYNEAVPLTGSGDTRDFIMPASNVTVTATFTQNYSITTSVMPQGSGSVGVSPNGPYHFGDQITLTAIANTGYTFSSWDVRDTNNNSIVVADNQFIMPASNVTVTATFTQYEYDITTSVTPQDAGSVGVSPNGPYHSGEQITLTATANTGYTFSSWDVRDTNNNFIAVTDNQFIMPASNVTVTATFTQYEYDITTSVTPQDAGSVGVSPNGPYHSGEQITLTATANSGYTFSAWDVKDANNNPIDVTNNQFVMPASNVTVTATFNQDEYDITTSVTPQGAGSVGVSPNGPYYSGDQITLTATANSGYTFSAWDVEDANNNPIDVTNNQFIMPASNVTVTAIFIQQFTIMVSADPTNGGTVSGGGVYQQGQSCTVTANASSGYVFTNWTENGNVVSTEINYIFTVTGDRTLVAHFNRLFTVNVSANPMNYGTVTGGGQYQQGQQCTVTATANTGYTFTNWTENSNVVSTNANYTFTVTGNRTLVAHFEVQAPNNYNINVSANPSNGGSVTGGGQYQQGQQCTVSAIANTGYTFTSWTENGNVVSTNANYNFTVTSNRTLVANFQLQSFTITISADPSNGGNVSGGGSYNYGQVLTIHAAANTGYTFTNWTENGNIVSTNADYTFTVEGDRTLVAHFAQLYTINVSPSPANGGTVSGGGQYQQGQQCTVSATANTGYIFTNWTENGNVVSTNPNYTFTVSANRNLVAHFAQLYTISVSASPTQGGTVSGGGQYQYGQPCTVHATASSNFVFTNWTENGNVVSTDAHFTFTVTGNRTLVAHFNQLYTIKVSADPEEGGVVSGSGTYQQGQSCTVIATSADGYRFVEWTENGEQISTGPNYTFTVTRDCNLVAKFEILPPNTYYINVSPNPPSGGIITGGGSYEQNTFCTVAATPNEGYRFINWTENGVEVPNAGDEYTFEVTGSRTLIANFEQQKYTIKVSAHPTDGGTVSGGGLYNHGESCTVHATPEPGYNFVNWTENGSIASLLPDYNFDVEGDRTLVANFIKQEFMIEVSAYPDEGGTVTGGGDYVYGISCTVQATPNEGYEFENWTENGLVVCIERRYTFLVENDRTLVANFTSSQYSINVEATEGGSVTVSQYEATAGTPITITINESDGFELDTIIVYNTDNPLQTVPVTNCEFTMPYYSVTVKAEFKQKTLKIDPPDAICSGESLDLTELLPQWVQYGYWQLSETDAFYPQNTFTYTDQTLDASYNGWYLRYCVQLSNHVLYSNVVRITVYGMEDMALKGDQSVSIDQEVEYRLVIEGQNNYTDYSYNWSVSDGQAITIDTVNRFKVTWKTAGEQQVSVIVTDNSTGCSDTLSLDVNVMSCIDNLQEIVAKTHTEGDDTYILILVYPNLDNEGNPSDVEYKYQWRFSSDGEHYSDLTEGTCEKQYYYKGGPLMDGFYKVRISKGTDCSVETKPYKVKNDVKHLRIYPNPSRRGSSIVVMNDSDGSAQLAIYSTDGRVLHTQTVTDSQATVNISLPQGVYVVYLTNSDGYTKVGKLIIQ